MGGVAATVVPALQQAVDVESNTPPKIGSLLLARRIHDLTQYKESSYMLDSTIMHAAQLIKVFLVILGMISEMPLLLPLTVA